MIVRVSGTSRVKDKGRRPWLLVILGSESLVSLAVGVLLVETARRSGLAGHLTRRLGPWRKAVYHPQSRQDLRFSIWSLGGTHRVHDRAGPSCGRGARPLPDPPRSVSSGAMVAEVKADVIFLPRCECGWVFNSL